MSISTCRVCLKAKCEKRVTFDVDSDWASLFEYCTGLVVQHEEKAPKIFCGDCAAKLKDYSEFKKRCIKSNTLWTDISSISVVVDKREKEVPKANNMITFDVKTEHSDDDRMSYEGYQEKEIKKEKKMLLAQRQSARIHYKKEQKQKLEKEKEIKKEKELKKKVDNKISKKDIQVIHLKGDQKNDTEQNDGNKTPKNEIQVICIKKEHTGDPVPKPKVLKLKETIFNDENKHSDDDCMIYEDYQEMEMDDSKQDSDNKMTKNEIQIIRITEEHIEIDDKVENLKELSKETMTKTEIIQKCFARLRFGCKLPMFRCYKCRFKVGSQKLLQHAINCFDLSPTKIELSNEEIDGATYCGICEFQSEDQNIVNRHFYEHITRHDLKCMLCDFVGIDIAHILSHRFKHFPSMPAMIRCPVCFEYKNSTIKIEHHYRLVHLKRPGGLCIYCNKTFSCPKTYENHVIGHEEGKTYICDLCEKSFNQRSSIILHLKEYHYNIKKNAYICHECGKVFKKHYNLYSHLRSHANEPVVCKHCNRTYKSKFTLEDHLSYIAKEKKFICEICSKAFVYETELMKHKFWHTSEKPHLCKTCNKSFRTKSSLTVHKRIHTGEKPYQCKLCSKAFHCTTLLLRHKTFHTGVRAVKCLYCDNTFWDKRAMMRHCKRQHECVPLTSSCIEKNDEPATSSV